MNDSGLLVQITPVVIQPIVKPLNLVVISPRYNHFFLRNNKIPPTISPKPEPNSP